MDIKEIINQLLYCINRKDYTKLEESKAAIIKAKIDLDELDITKIEFEKFRVFVNESLKHIDEAHKLYNAFTGAAAIIDLHIDAEVQDQRKHYN